MCHKRQICHKHKPNRDRPSQHPSELSNNAMEEYSTKLLLNQGAYWPGSKWNCKSCKYSYDGPGMIQHLRLSHKQLQTQEEVISELKDEGRLPRQYKTN